MQKVFKILSDVFDEYTIAQIDSIIDYKAISAKYCIAEKDLDLKRRKKTEFLVETNVPPTVIVGWAVYNEYAKDLLIAMGIGDLKIIVKPDFYF